MHMLFYGNGSSGNHGCEAIVRGTQALLPDAEFSLISENMREDALYGLDKLAHLLPATQERKKDLRFLNAYAKLKLFRNYVDMDGLRYLPGIQAMKGKVDIALSVGGDNYCYGGTGLYAYLNRAYQQQGIRTVLWGCSVEPDVVKQPEVAKDLARYHRVVARESITYEAIKAVQPHTILAPDPAFFMDPVPCAADERLTKGKVIGINASPHILKCGVNSDIIQKNYRQLIAYILKETDATVALIPHVVWSTNDDRTVLRQLYEDFDRHERLILVEDHTAPELKFLISHCDFFVGARTHATIAAYSTGVPTLVVGYSVKARGIARDLFGTEEGYVLPVQELSSPEQLTKAFCALYEKRKYIRNLLALTLPNYRQNVQQAVNTIKDLRKT